MQFHQMPEESNGFQKSGFVEEPLSALWLDQQILLMDKPSLQPLHLTFVISALCVVLAGINTPQHRREAFGDVREGDMRDSC